MSIITIRSSNYVRLKGKMHIVVKPMHFSFYRGSKRINVTERVLLEWTETWHGRLTTTILHHSHTRLMMSRPTRTVRRLINVFCFLFFSSSFRSVRKSVAARGREKGGKTQEHCVQMQPEPDVWREIRVHVTGGTAEGGGFGGDGHGLWQYRPQRAHRQDYNIMWVLLRVARACYLRITQLLLRLRGEQHDR